MLVFLYHGKKAVMEWYVQDLISKSKDLGLGLVYGQELLCRAYIDGSDELISMPELFNYINNNEELLLDMTSQQLEDIFFNASFNCLVKGSIWVNLSGVIVSNSILFSKLKKKVLDHLSPSQKELLVLEISESDSNSTSAISVIKSIKNIGIKIALDDFGSGYSNLQRLIIPYFNYIKIDLSLLADVPACIWASSFYFDIIQLCSATGCLVVAEGIETQEQSDFVRILGIDIFQGFFYSRPRPIQGAFGTIN